MLALVLISPLYVISSSNETILDTLEIRNDYELIKKFTLALETLSDVNSS